MAQLYLIMAWVHLVPILTIPITLQVMHFLQKQVRQFGLTLDSIIIKHNYLSNQIKWWHSCPKPSQTQLTK